MAFLDKFAESSNFFAAPLGSWGSLLECMLLPFIICNYIRVLWNPLLVLCSHSSLYGQSQGESVVIDYFQDQHYDQSSHGQSQ